VRHLLVGALLGLSSCARWIDLPSGEGGVDSRVELSVAADSPREMVPAGDAALERPVAIDGRPDGRRPDGTTPPLPDLARDNALLPDKPLPDKTNVIVPGSWVSLAAGAFAMGSPPSEPCRSVNEDQHQVTLTHKLEVMAQEVTQAEFETVRGYQPVVKYCATCPVYQITWSEAAAYCNALSTLKGLSVCYACSGAAASVSCAPAAAFSGQAIYGCPGYRLPTEAEWEYAYRAGTSTALYNGAITGCKTDANADLIGWYKAPSVQSVGTKAPNAWGLYDLAGNVWEWTNDWWVDALGTGPAIDPWGVATATQKVVRGGSYAFNSEMVRAAYRSFADPQQVYADIGLRCVRSN
jgi:formylglycine-generating enzyme required for sulfatase activity